MPPTSPDDAQHTSAPEGAATPVPLRVAAAIAALQGLVLVGLCIAELASLNSQRLEMGTTTAFFFGAFGAGLLACAYGLLRVRTWARGPVLLAQLVQLGLAWNFADGAIPVALVLAVVAIVALACLVHKESIAALEHRELDPS